MVEISVCVILKGRTCLRLNIMFLTPSMQYFDKAKESRELQQRMGFFLFVFLLLMMEVYNSICIVSCDYIS